MVYETSRAKLTDENYMNWVLVQYIALIPFHVSCWFVTSSPLRQLAGRDDFNSVHVEGHGLDLLRECTSTLKAAGDSFDQSVSQGMCLADDCDDDVDRNGDVSNMKLPAPGAEDFSLNVKGHCLDPSILLTNTACVSPGR